MTHPTDPSRSTSPTVAEIAELTARLRNLSGRGRAVDPAERAAFVTDKDALLARIAAQEPAHSERPPHPWAATADAVAHTHVALGNRAELGATTDDALADERWWAQAHSSDADTAPVTFDASGYYSIAEIAAIADARAAGDTERAQFLQDRPWLVQGVTVDTNHVRVSDDQAVQGETDEAVARPVMPEWMREQARRTEAEIAAELREQATTRDADPSTRQDSDRAALSGVVETEMDAEVRARREQLARWHTDDTNSDTDTDTDTDTDGYGDGDDAAVGPGDHVILVTGDEQP